MGKWDGRRFRTFTASRVWEHVGWPWKHGANCILCIWGPDGRQEVPFPMHYHLLKKQVEGSLLG